MRERIIVDCDRFNLDDGDLSFAEGPIYKAKLGEHLNMSDDELLICNHDVSGFSLISKKWYWFDVSNIKEINFMSDAFDRLVLPQNIKTLIRSLVVTKPETDKHFDDFIEGKGKGIVILLHGPPGVGKTFTAGK